MAGLPGVRLSTKGVAAAPPGVRLSTKGVVAGLPGVRLSTKGVGAGDGGARYGRAVSDADFSAVDVAGVTSLVRAALPRAREVLDTLIRVPSVSSAGPEDVERSADAVAAAFAGLPGIDVEVLRAGGAPAVIARRAAPPGAPTVLLYAHHDVQPTGDEALWTSPPFEPTLRQGRLFGRGAADDKAGVTAHLAALTAHLAAHPDTAGVGVTVFVEGEEEVGSPTLAAFIDAYADRLAADVLVIADSTNAAVGLPALTTTLRGLVSVDVTVRALDHAVHSGIFGGAAPDAVAALLVTLSSLWAVDGSVAVRGLPAASDAAIGAGQRQRPWPQEEFAAAAGALPGQLIGRGPITQRVWLGPAVTVIGLDVPTVAAASNTLYPRARARVSMRVPPGGDVRTALAALEAHLRGAVPWGLAIEVVPVDQGAGFGVDTSTPAYRAARWALAHAWGADPVDIGIGGSIPFVADLAGRFPGVAVLVTGVEDPDSRAHGIDESLHVQEWERACVAEALLLEAMATTRGNVQRVAPA